MCPIELGARGGNPDRGMLDLQASGDYCSEAGGAGDIEDMIEWGAPGTCLINTQSPPDCDPNTNGPWYDCVAVQQGNPQKVLDGTHARLARDGACDTDGDGVDEFDESVEMVFDTGDPFTSIYEARDCDPDTPGRQISPRLVTIIILEEDPDLSSNTGYPIIAFAGFYLAGCAHEDVTVDDESDLDRDCDTPGGGPPPPGSCGAPGHCVVYGRFVKLIVAGGEVGPPNDQSTLFGISLVE
jgi:hypothetical protein